ncbi:hypothetical protein SISSUDRAFT_1038149 [Sistotremastrum suecicum HHB10207 ss-3]|uniref:Uncharacterized protein n=1 Tax=Sistotremastrum suecicum HHB10207 ss-3 TaxID=1314776 RepID=A0A165X5V9_9AGAM|nr:hypothetical protein SISSUDRAFT_1038149 [Sistotremastrum suecicum HHB10207 ss-3]
MSLLIKQNSKSATARRRDLIFELRRFPLRMPSTGSSRWACLSDLISSQKSGICLFATSQTLNVVLSVDRMCDAGAEGTGVEENLPGFRPGGSSSRNKSSGSTFSETLPGFEPRGTSGRPPSWRLSGGSFPSMVAYETQPSSDSRATDLGRGGWGSMGSWGESSERGPWSESDTRPQSRRWEMDIDVASQPAILDGRENPEPLHSLPTSIEREKAHHCSQGIEETWYEFFARRAREDAEKISSETKKKREDRLSRGRNPRTTKSRKNKPTYFWWEPSAKNHTFLIRTHMFHKEAEHHFGGLPHNQKLYNTVRNEWDMGPIIAEVPRNSMAYHYDYTPAAEEEDLDYSDSNDSNYDFMARSTPIPHPEPPSPPPIANVPHTPTSTPPTSPLPFPPSYAQPPSPPPIFNGPHTPTSTPPTSPRPLRLASLPPISLSPIRAEKPADDVTSLPAEGPIEQPSLIPSPAESVASSSSVQLKEPIEEAPISCAVPTSASSPLPSHTAWESLMQKVHLSPTLAPPLFAEDVEKFLNGFSDLSAFSLEVHPGRAVVLADPRAVLPVERCGASSIEMLYNVLFENGVSFSIHDFPFRSSNPVPPPPPYKIPRYPHSHTFDRTDYESYIERRAKFIKQRGFACLRHGGLPWRFARDVLPSAAVELIVTSEVANDPPLRDDEIKLLVGLVEIDTADSKGKISATVSYWPHPRFFVHQLQGVWSDYNETWYQERREELEGKFALPVPIGSTKWRDKCRGRTQHPSPKIDDDMIRRVQIPASQFSRGLHKQGSPPANCQPIELSTSDPNCYLICTCTSLGFHRPETGCAIGQSIHLSIADSDSAPAIG